MIMRIWFMLKETEGTTYLTGVGHDAGEVLRHVHRLGAVRANVRDFRVIGHNEREALAVDDMPVERVDLGFSRSPSGIRLNEGYQAITHIDPGHHVERAFNVGQREAKTGTW
jgi:hypothetical protein